jgi:integrase
MSAGLSINTSLFDFKKGRVKRSATNAFEINQYLDNLSQEIKNYYTGLKANHESVTKVLLKNKLKSIINPESSVNTISPDSFFKQFDNFIEERKNNLKFSFRTIQRYVAAKRHLENFTHDTGYKVIFDSINEEFADKFVMYLIQTVDLVNNSVEGILKTLKVFLNNAVEKGISTNLRFKKVFGEVSHSFKLKTETQSVALTMDEIHKLETVKLSTKRLRQVRDLFLIQIYTCMRYSDLANLKPENIYIDEGVIKIYQQKTVDATTIPLSKKLESVLKKYDGFKLPKYSNQKFNNYIKEVC